MLFRICLSVFVSLLLSVFSFATDSAVSPGSSVSELPSAVSPPIVFAPPNGSSIETPPVEPPASSSPPSVEAVPPVPDVVPPASDVPPVTPVEPPVEPYIAPVDYPGSITNPATLIYDFDSAFKSLRIYAILIFFELGLLILCQFLKP